MAAIYWTRLAASYYAASKEDAAAISFDDQMIYEEIARPVHQRKLFTQQLMQSTVIKAFEQWKASAERIKY
jgi:tRNA(Arg) A34 adenosine deaminase TadA